MTEITIYRADDGTDFEDEWDCQQYEWRQSCENAEYTLLDNRFRILPTDETSSYEDAFFIFIPTQQSAFELFANWDTDMIRVDCPSFLPCRADHEVEIGLWAWDEDDEKWYHLGKKIDELTQVANRAMNAINGA